MFNINIMVFMADDSQGVTYNGEGQSISGIQLCQSSLEHFFWTSPRFWVRNIRHFNS